MGQKFDELNSLAEELYEINSELNLCVEKFDLENFKNDTKDIADKANKVGESWSGSWIGYHANVYYEGLIPPPAGAQFSPEWGSRDQLFNYDTSGDWQEYQFEEIKKYIYEKSDHPDLSKYQLVSDEGKQLFQEKLPELVSIVGTAYEIKSDKFLKKILDELEEKRIMTASDFIDYLKPSKIFSRDSLAVSQGLKTPPHIAVLADVNEISSPIVSCKKISKLALQAASHLERVSKNSRRKERIGTNIFIGHGQSMEWKELKDFIQDRLQLPWDEFNRVPVAGITNIARLSEMLDSAAFAFLVMTAEDEQADGSLQARMNVIHEAGLFQGRLGFNRAIILLEDGCKEFSNIQGLGQIRFPQENIKAIFEDIREVLEREEIIESE